MYPERVLNSPNVDYIVRFEGEKPFLQLVESFARGETRPDIPNVGWREGSKIVLQPRAPLMDLEDALPLDFSDITSPRYIMKGGLLPCRRAVSFFSSRGCPYRCKYCYNLYYNQGRWRCFPSEWVVNGIEKLVRTFDIDGLYFSDDNFAVNANRVMRILREVRDRGINLIYWWEMRVDQVLQLGVDGLKEMHALGLAAVFLGAESGSDDCLETLNKGFRVKETRRANQMLAESGIRICYSMMIGIPEETEAEMIQTIDFTMELFDSHPGVSIWQISNYVAFPGTPLYDEIHENRSAAAANPSDSVAVSFLQSSNRQRQCISYASIFLKDDEFIKNSPLFYRLLFLFFRPISIFRLRRHFFWPFIDTWLIAFMLKVKHHSGKIKK